jgi:outer membrane protein assembly complex protein YaeT
VIGAYRSILSLLRTAILGLCFAKAAMATPWTIRENLIPDSTMSRLSERYPSVRNATDLENLLRDIARRHPLGRLDATMVNGVWVISGKSALTIHEIQIETTTRVLRRPLQASLFQYIGQVDAPEIRSKIASTAARYMKRRGYPKAQIDVTAEPSEDGISYQLTVTEGAPCVLEKIELGFKLPPQVKLDLRRGSVCDLEAIESATSELEAALREFGYNQLKIQLEDLQYNFERDTATVRVQGILGQRIKYQIVDQTKNFLIDDLFADEELTKVDPTIVGPDAMGAELARRYRQRGYVDVVIKGPEVKKTSESEFIYTYFVDPGSQYTLKEVKFEGVKAFSETDILDTIKLRSFWQASRPANYEEIQAGINALKARYQQAGYWDVQIQDPGLGQRDKDAGTVRLVIQVEEGVQRVLGEVSVTGNAEFSRNKILEFLGTKKGDALDRAKLVDIQQQIRAAYMSRGYLYSENKIDLKAHEDQKQIIVDINITIEEGPRVAIGDIVVVGLARTQEKVVRRELLIQDGDWYDPEKIALSRQALTNLGIFRSVQINPADRNALTMREKKIDLIVEVQEGRAGNVAFGPGWSVAKGWNYVAEASYNNIGGGGRAASIRGVISEEVDQYAIGNKTLVGRRVGAGYTEPFMFNYPVDGRVKLNHRAEWSGELWALRYGGELELVHRLRLLLPRSTISTFYSQEIAKSEGSTIKESQLVASDVRIGAVGTRFSIDRRDIPKFPTSGYTLDTELAWARYELGGDLRYFKWDITSNRYFQLYPNFVLALGLNLSSFDDIQRKGQRLGVLPPSERLYAGGADTVRGFKPRSLGPIVIGPTYTVDEQTKVCDFTYTTTRLDGSARTTLKSELRHKWNEDFALSFFVDNGNVFLSKDQTAKFEDSYADRSGIPAECQSLGLKNKLYDNYSYSYGKLLRDPSLIWNKNFFSYGMAFNLLTPIGSINFAYGLPWKEPKSEACRIDKAECHPRSNTKGHWISRGEFHINVGAQF